jgi:hypothetical protein
MKKIIFFFCLIHGALFGQDAILKSNENQIFSLTAIQMQNTKMVVADKIQDLSWNFIQMGNQNSVSFKMSGENSFDFIQKGNGNSIDMTLPGENNFFKFEQLGNQNRLQLNEIMFRSGMLEVLQEGNGNALLESGGGLSFPMKIEQRGGMRIEINSIINGFQ